MYNHLILDKGNPATAELYAHIRLVAPTDLTLLIEGESGTGKEHVARYVHQLSPRKHKPFVAIDCGVLSEELAGSELFGSVKGAFTGAVADKKGHFELADGGTLFLDEIGNMSYEIQVKLLRAIQERVITPTGGTKKQKVDVRIIAATNEDLSSRVEAGEFREDLYYRINEFKIKIPALRERMNDFDTFLHHFLKKTNTELGKNVRRFSDALLAILKSYKWPGNLRELNNTIRRMVLLTEGPEIQVSTLPEELIPAATGSFSPTTDLKLLQQTQEREWIINTLETVRYNKSKAARLLCIDRKTLYYKMAKYGIK